MSHNKQSLGLVNIVDNRRVSVYISAYLGAEIARQRKKRKPRVLSKE